MAKVFSPSRRLFYAPELKDRYGPDWPTDGVTVPDDAWRQFVAPSPPGKALGDDAGQPVWVDAPPSSVSPSATMALARSALTRSDSIVVRCYEAGIPVPEPWRSYRAALRAIADGSVTATALPAVPALPEGI